MANLKSTVICALAYVVLPALAIAQTGPSIPESVTWKERIYNPQPDADDLVLPMNCGGAMVFRRVTTPNTDGVVGDVPVLLGQQGSDQPFLDGLRRSYISGAFPNEDGTTRGHYYIAKYELTEAQYAVGSLAEGDACPKRISRKLAIPQTGLDKLALERFAQNYTLWLMHNAPEALPKVGETLGFVRLPSEEEWEFAARGGLDVSEAEFRAARPPIPEGDDLNEYIAHTGSDSAGGTLQIAGTLKPNPLGLHDMLGNAWEMVGSPFALVRHGRLHGQTGGIIRRGGGVDWPLAEITSAQRYEMAPYNLRTQEVRSDRFTGARFAISAISITSNDQNDALIRELDRIAAPDPSLASAKSEAEIRALLEDMQRAALTQGDRDRLQIISETLAAAQVERNTQRDKSLRMILNSAVLLCNQAAQRYLTQRFAAQTVLEDLKFLEADARAQGDENYLAEVLAARDEALAKLERLGELLNEDAIEYANLIEGLGADHDPNAIRSQADFVRPDHQKNARRSACYDLLRTHLETRFAAGITDITAMRDDFRTVADIAIEK